LPAKARRSGWLYSEHPTTSIRFNESPLSEYRCAKVEQQCGGILARLQPVYAREKEFSGVTLDRASTAGVEEAARARYGFKDARPPQGDRQLQGE
jgi:hypothetical protein